MIFFFTELGGFDSHNNVEETLLSTMSELDAALEHFVAELKEQGLWNHVTIVTVSDFGRTLTSNGKGTDHAWGGNHVVLGGDIKGSQILGKFPSSLLQDADLMIGRGRVLPTSSWEALWQPLLQWIGIEKEQLPEVLPNLANFPSSQLISQQDLFMT